MATEAAEPQVCEEEQPWKIAMDLCRLDICNDLQPLEVLPSLQAKRVISQPMKDSIMKHQIRFERNDALVTWLLTGPETTFKVFCEVLINTRQGHIEEKIRREVFAIKAGLSDAKEVEEIRQKLITLMNCVGEQNVDTKTKALVNHPKGLVVVTGGKGRDGIMNVCRAYDIASNKWDDGQYISNMPNGSYSHSLVEYDGLLWAIGGTQNRGIEPSWVQKFDVLSVNDKTWLTSPVQSKDDFGLLAAVKLRESLYAVGYYKDEHKERWIIILILQKDLVWREVSKRKSEWNSAGLAVLNDIIYFCGSCDKLGSGLRFDSSTNSWGQMASPSYCKWKWHFKAVALHGCIVAIGGTRFDVCERYHPTTDKWDYLTELPWSAVEPAVTTDGERIFVIGGSLIVDGEEEILNLHHIYDYKHNQWTIATACPVKFVGASAAFVSPEKLQAGAGTEAIANFKPGDQKSIFRDLPKQDFSYMRPKIETV